MANLYGYNTSSAHKLDYDYDRRRKEEKKQLHKTEPATKVAGNTKKNPAKSLSAFMKVAVCFAVAFAIVNGYVKINEANGEAARLESNLHDMEARNESLKMKIDKAFSPEQLQVMAVEEYGMVRPEQHQVFYIDMGQEDYAETPGVDNKTEGQSAVKGTVGSITGELNIFN